MCNIAGYIGSRRAAPILVDMIRKQEGLNGGFFTGIVTVAEDGLHYAKVVGDLDTLLRETDALDLPGTTGLIHSRTPGGGAPRSWSHPFISNDGRLGLVVNGSVGAFDGVTDFRGAVQALLDKGYHFPSRTEKSLSKAKYTGLADGTCVHVSELFCLQTEEHLRQGDAPLQALMRTLSTLHAEVVMLMVHGDHPGVIDVARANMPMYCARAEGGEMFLASSPTAFPQNMPYLGVDLLPANAGSEVTRDGWRVAGCVDPTLQVGQITASMIAKAYELIGAQIQLAGEQGVVYPETAKTCRGLFPKNVLRQSNALSYMVLDSLMREGLVTLRHDTKPGEYEGLTAPVERIIWKKAEENA